MTEESPDIPLSAAATLSAPNSDESRLQTGHTSGVLTLWSQGIAPLQSPEATTEAGVTCLKAEEMAASLES